MGGDEAGAPVVGRGVDAFALVALEELGHVGDPHRAACAPRGNHVNRDAREDRTRKDDDGEKTRTDDLADAGHEQVAALGVVLVPGALLHVEALERLREARQEHGHAHLVRHLALGGLGDVVAHAVGAGLARLLVLGVDAVLLEPGDRLPVVEPQEGARGRGELGVERVDLGARLGVGEERVDDRADLDGQTSGEVLCQS